MKTNADFFLLLSFILIVPILPAYLMFKVLPGTGNVHGKLRGLEIKLGGAFAGYFALVLLVVSELPKIKAALASPPPTTQVWEVEGQVMDEGNKEAIEPLTPEDIKIDPAVLKFNNGGWFRATIATYPGTSGQGIEFPKLFLSHKGYGDKRIDLNPAKTNQEILVSDEQNHSIKLQPIMLKKPEKSYSPNGAAPQPDPAGYAASIGKRGNVQ